jgi:hypothetical protein
MFTFAAIIMEQKHIYRFFLTALDNLVAVATLLFSPAYRQVYPLRA